MKLGIRNFGNVKLSLRNRKFEIVLSGIWNLTFKIKDWNQKFLICKQNLEIVKTRHLNFKIRKKEVWTHKFWNFLFKKSKIINQPPVIRIRVWKIEIYNFENQNSIIWNLKFEILKIEIDNQNFKNLKSKILQFKIWKLKFRKLKIQIDDQKCRNFIV